MSFNKRFVGKKQIEEIEFDIDKVSYYILSDCLIFESQKISNQFKEYEKIYKSNRSLTF
jgi:hypothetical protein